MSFDLERLYNLLPAIYRIRDAENGYTIKALLTVIAEQAAVLEDNLEQLYDDQFIETCAEWIVPYIGDLIGATRLDSLQRAPISESMKMVLSGRARVANTLSYRRQKGTLAVIERLARDVTGWDARAVEFFQRLAATQHVNHTRLFCRSCTVADAPLAFENIDSAFDSAFHTVQTGNVSAGFGRYNIPNVGIFLWRLRPYAATCAPAYRVDGRRYLFSPLGSNVQLFTNPRTETDAAHIAETENVPRPISRDALDSAVGRYYCTGGSIELFVDGDPVDAESIVACDLSDYKDSWAHHPPKKYGIDPELGRISIPTGGAVPASVAVSYHYGFSADVGGGEYERSGPDSHINTVVEVPGQKNSIEEAINEIGTGSGLVRISGSGRYEETIEAVQISAKRRMEIRAGARSRPVLVLPGEVEIKCRKDSELVIDGLLISGGTLRITGSPRLLRLRHCTLVPGLALERDGSPVSPDAPSLIVATAQVSVEIDSCIVGALRIDSGAKLTAVNSIIDATSPRGFAYTDTGGASYGGEISMRNCTVIGKVRAVAMREVSNTIFVCALSKEGGTWASQVVSERRQEGCVRFSYLPPGSLVPGRYRCHPESEESELRVQPRFTSLCYGEPGYGQLAQWCPREISRGAEDDSEMGAFHDLYQARRDANLQVCLDEYLRFDLEAGIFYET